MLCGHMAKSSGPGGPRGAIPWGHPARNSRFSIPVREGGGAKNRGTDDSAMQSKRKPRENRAGSGVKNFRHPTAGLENKGSANSARGSARSGISLTWPIRAGYPWEREWRESKGGAKKFNRGREMPSGPKETNRRAVFLGKAGLFLGKPSPSGRAKSYQLLRDRRQVEGL